MGSLLVAVGSTLNVEMDAFFEEHVDMFDQDLEDLRSGRGETLEQFDAFARYKEELEKHFDEFARLEGFASASEWWVNRLAVPTGHRRGAPLALCLPALFQHLPTQPSIPLAPRNSPPLRVCSFDRINQAVKRDALRQKEFMKRLHEHIQQVTVPPGASRKGKSMAGITTRGFPRCSFSCRSSG